MVSVSATIVALSWLGVTPIVTWSPTARPEPATVTVRSPLAAGPESASVSVLPAWCDTGTTVQ